MHKIPIAQPQVKYTSTLSVALVAVWRFPDAISMCSTVFLPAAEKIPCSHLHHNDLLRVDCTGR